MSILYRYGDNWYVNMTNRCPCRCVFCVRNNTRALGDADDLWLDREPTAREVVDEVMERAPDAEEVVFCGYGEPTERLDDLIAIAREVRARTGARIRLDTNGLGSLINGRDIVPELAEVLDAVSVSLNASNAEEYMRVSRPSFGPQSYDAVREFIAESRRMISGVTVSVVGGSIPESSVEECRRMAREWGVRFRVRRRLALPPEIIQSLSRPSISLIRARISAVPIQDVGRRKEEKGSGPNILGLLRRIHRSLRRGAGHLCRPGVLRD